MNLQRALPVKKASRAIRVFWTLFKLPPQSRLREHGAAFSVWGGYEQAERQIGCFLPWGEEASSSDFPLVCLHSRFSSKFCSLSHRDLLGAFMALGLTRDSIGDIIIVDSDIYLFVMAQTADFIMQGMHSAGKAALRFEPVTGEIRIPEPRGSCFHDTLSSLRLDAVGQTQSSSL